MTSFQDAIQLEIANNFFAAIAEEMGHTLMRSAFSPNIKERRDFSCAIFDTRGRMIAQAAHIPVHLGSAPLSVQAVASALKLDRGQHGIVNDPFSGGTHLPDITLVTPIFAPGGTEPSFYAANRAHHADVGGSTPGSMPLTTDMADEGVCIPPSVLTPELEADFLAKVRGPQERQGDLQAQRAANEVGVRQMESWIAAQGLDAVEQSVEALVAWSTRLMADVLQKLPDGTYCAEGLLDGDGLDHRDIPIRVSIEIQGTTMVVDYTQSGDQVPGPLNAVRAIAVSAVHYVLRCLAPQGMPSNDGFMSLVEIKTRPGSVVDALSPAPVGAGNVETSQRLVDVLLLALSPALPDTIPASSCGTMSNILFGGNTASGGSFTYYETIGGGSGASAAGPGASGIQTHMTNTLNTPVEALEHAVPVRIEAYRTRPDSGGKGQHRGGDGIERVYHFLNEAEVTLIGERHIHPAPGAQGGGPGSLGSHRVEGSMKKNLPGKIQIQVQPGDTLFVLTPGGGGFGPHSVPED
jgi:N-methylhydantoinase B